MSKKFIRKFENRKLKSYIIYFPLVAIYCIWTINNFIFSESFSILRLRGIDDIAFTNSTIRILENLSFNINKILISVSHLNDYGYGFLFWIFSSLAVAPFYFFWRATQLEIMQSQIIFMSRQTLSTVLLISIVFLLINLNRDANRKQRTINTVVITCLAFSPFTSFVAMRFHPMALAMTAINLAIGSIFGKLKIKMGTHQFPMSYVFASIAVGVKFNSLLAVPLIILLETFIKSDKKINVFQIFLRISLVSITGIFLATPTIITEFILYGKSTYFSQIFMLTNQLSQNPLEVNQILNNIVHGIFLPAFISLIGLFYMWNAIFKSKLAMAKLSIVVSIYTTAVMLYLPLSIDLGSTYVTNYLSCIAPIVYLTPFLYKKYLQITFNLSRMLAAILTATVMTQVYYLNQENEFFSILSWIQKEKSNVSLQQRKEIDFVSKAIDEVNNFRVLQDFEISTPFSITNDSVEISWLFSYNEEIKKKIHDCHFDYLILRTNWKEITEKAEEACYSRVEETENIAIFKKKSVD